MFVSLNRKIIYSILLLFLITSVIFVYTFYLIYGTKIQEEQQRRIREATRRLEDSETWGDVRKLVNHEYDYRLRVNDYRVLFNPESVK